jgi:hypothetical protein
MKREDAWEFVAYCVDDAGSPRKSSEIPDPSTDVVLVGWQCGFEPMFVAVWSYLPNTRIDDDEAEQLAIDLLMEVGWFGTEPHREPDYIL